MAAKRKLNGEQNSEDIKKRSNLNPLPHRLPVKLLNEMFACLPLENAYGLLTAMPNDLLAKNVRKMLSNIKMTMKMNKWNVDDCGPNLTISEDGHEVEHAGPRGVNCVRAQFPIRAKYF